MTNILKVNIGKDTLITNRNFKYEVRILKAEYNEFDKLRMYIWLYKK